MTKQLRPVLVVAAVLAALAGTEVEQVSAQTTSNHPLTVRRWTVCPYTGCTGTSVPFTNAEADSAFSAATTILQNDSDGPGPSFPNDITCIVALQRSGNVQAFYLGDPDVSSTGDYNSIKADGGFVKIVNTITWCGTGGSFYGCTSTGARNTMMLTRTVSTGALRGQAWAHEFGHSVNLPANHAGTVDGQIMFSPTTANDVNVTNAHCTAYRDNNVDHNGPLQSGEPHIPLDLSAINIDEMAHSVILDRMPIEVVERYSQADVEILRSLLTDPSENYYHLTIAALIGLISDGSEVDSAALINFVDGNSGEESPRVSAAIIGLGYIANRGNDNALKYLLTKTDDTKTPVGEWAVNALGLSGRAEALARLEELRLDADPSDAQPRRQGRSIETIDDAIDTVRAIMSQGLVGYYSSR